MDLISTCISRDASSDKTMEKQFSKLNTEETFSYRYDLYKIIN